jgi:sialate O-acetylesterase
MVLQQQTEAPIWGKATPKKNVRLITSWDNRSYSSLSDSNGNWMIKVQTPAAGGPYSISISDGKELVLKDILIGEVWICSGQSNMEMPLAGWGKILNYENEIASANYPSIRLLHIQRTISAKPEDDVKTVSGGWQVCSPATIPGFSSVGYFFGRELFTKLNIPIGLINTSWGGTIAEAWTSGESLELMPDFRNAVKAVREQTASESNPATPQTPVNPNRTTLLYNSMIYPLAPYAFQGAIWYQGESNADRAYQYRDLFPLMIYDWRKTWNKDFPFYFVQLANFMKRETEPQESRWAELREAQFRTLRLKNTGMAVAIDIGDADDIHPKNKQDVGKRLAAIAEANTYRLSVAFSGPLYESYIIEGNTIRIKFKHVENGLKTNDGNELTGFAIAGPDHRFLWAKAVIDGKDVVVSSPDVEFPVAVRYGWANNPECNLFNSANLPASPFRTDDWK